MRHRHFAVVNHLYPDVHDPFLLLRQRAGGRFERYDENRDWVPAGRRWLLGEPVGGTALDRLLTSWTPRPPRVEHRYYAFLDVRGDPLRLAHLWNDAGGVVAERTFVSERWRVVGPCVFEGDRRVEIDQARARELEAVVTRLSDAPVERRYLYWAVVDPVLQRVLRTWGGDDGTRYAEWSTGRGWYRVHVLDVVHDGTAVPITEERSEELRRSFPAVAAPSGCHQPS